MDVILLGQILGLVIYTTTLWVSYSRKYYEITLLAAAGALTVAVKVLFPHSFLEEIAVNLFRLSWVLILMYWAFIQEK